MKKFNCSNFIYKFNLFSYLFNTERYIYCSLVLGWDFIPFLKNWVREILATFGPKLYVNQRATLNSRISSVYSNRRGKSKSTSVYKRPFAFLHFSLFSVSFFFVFCKNSRISRFLKSKRVGDKSSSRWVGFIVKYNSTLMCTGLREGIENVPASDSGHCNRGNLKRCRNTTKNCIHLVIF